MTTVTIKGIPVKFPFTPYDIQRNYMEKVIECLETGQNGILESPTGTGKTLSLLCASLAWLEQRKAQYEEQVQKTLSENLERTDDTDEGGSVIMNVPKIIYASRTHSQIHQAMQEMKRTAYSHMKACVLGSREQMCINSEVLEERNQAFRVNMCRTKVKKGHCLYYQRIEKQKRNPELCDLSIVDMEDIVDLGRSHDFCPYYMARELKIQADVIFMPYNYLIDPRMSKVMGFEFIGNIVILDEAHNIEKVCEDSVSVQIKTTDLQTAIDDVSTVIDSLNMRGCEEPDFSVEELETLTTILTSLKNELNKVHLVKLAAEGTVFDGDYIFEILQKSGVVEQNCSGIRDLVEKILEFLGTSKSIQTSGYSLQILNDLLFVVFYKRGPEFRQKIKECFKIQIEEEGIERFKRNRYSRFSQTIGEKCRVLSFWCFCPGFGMNMLMDQNIHCVILTSGTLAPLKPLISELEIDISIKMENPHIVKGDQVCVKILSNGPDSEILNSNFQNRNNPKYIQSLGLVISNLVRIIPDGVLIFFPSYVQMENSIQHWQASGIWDAINRTKPIYVEPKDKASFNTAMNEYYSKIRDPSYRGAIFIGVCRGKVSEGLDFADINGRAVFITGLPYPPLKDPKIILKKRYLDFRNSKDKEYLRGEEWYSLEATRAVNQAIGRVIRHKNDYGAIILLDSRFTNPRIKSNMSLWLRQHITDMRNFGEIIRHTRLFFQNAQEKMPQVEIKPIEIKPLVNYNASTSDNLMQIGDTFESPSKKQN